MTGLCRGKAKLSPPSLAGLVDETTAKSRFAEHPCDRPYPE